MKLFNRDPSTNLPNNISIGGLPLFNDDIIQLETNAIQFGIPSMFKGYSLILSGCLIDDLNITTKKCSITEGIILIDDVIYNIPRLENQTYPFSIIAGAQTIDTRTFQNGEPKDVSIEYFYAIKTSFVFDVNANYPNNLTTKEIYFDPFSLQRKEYLLSNQSKGIGELIFTKNSIFNITKTQTGKNIVGGAISCLNAFGNTLKWKYAGYTIFNNGTSQYLKNTLLGQTPVNTGGRTTMMLMIANLPAHSFSFSATTSTDGEHSHYNTYVGDSSLDSGGQFPLARQNADIYQGWSTLGLRPAGNHSHTITGNTNTLGSSSPINLDPLYTSAYFISYQGLNYLSANSTNGYKFWNTIYTPFENM